MNQTVTIEIVDTAAMRFLRELAAISLIRFQQGNPSENDITAQINKFCEEVDTSLDPCIMRAQAEVIGREDW